MSPSRRAASPGAEHLIMSLACRQHGVVARMQLLRAGVTSDIVDHRLRTGRIRRLHRGVYLVGPLTTPSTLTMAAVLACGDGAAASGRSAAALWNTLPPRLAPEPVDVVAARGRAGRRPGIRVRHMRTLCTNEVTVCDGVPVTTPARTLFDLSSMTGHRELERALAETFARRLARRSEVLAVLERHAGRPGAARLRALLEGPFRPALTRSEAEERFLALTRKARLRAPDTNARVAGYEVDFLWRSERLVVEVDGYAFHASERRYESDRRRDAELLAAGMRVMRVTWHQITHEPEAVLVRLAQAIALPARLQGH